MKEPTPISNPEGEVTEMVNKFYGKLRQAKAQGIEELAVDRRIILYYCGQDYKLDKFCIEGIVVYDKDMIDKEIEAI